MRTYSILLVLAAVVIVTACGQSQPTAALPAPTAPQAAAAGPIVMQVTTPVPSIANWKNIPVAEEAKAAAFELGPKVILRFYLYQAPREKVPSTLYISVGGNGYHLVSLSRKQDRTFSVLGLGQPQEISLPEGVTYKVTVTGYQGSYFLRLAEGFQVAAQ